MSQLTQAPAVPNVREQDLLQSGGFGSSTNSARAGYLPIAIERVPLGAMKGISVFLRVKSDKTVRGGATDGPSDHFALYCADTANFGEAERNRLQEHNVRFVCVRMVDQDRFRRQMETTLEELAASPAVAVSERSAIIYETSVELMNELLAEPDLVAQSSRLEHVSRAVTTLVLNNESAFSHLFAASHHDFYTATHMVNVATWMVPLAYEMGYRDPDELSHICQAGILHDMGKLFVPGATLNKPGKLSDDEWAQIKRHPEAGWEYLSKYSHINPIVLRVTREHHERADGSGYPRGLKNDEIHPISRICAVVDSFDAMTAFRPFKEKTLSVREAMNILRRESGTKYDKQAMDAWICIMDRADKEQDKAENTSPGTENDSADGLRGQRRHERQAFHCPARIHVMNIGTGGTTENRGEPIVAHSISQSGLGFLSRKTIAPGVFVRVYLEAKGWHNRPLEGQTVRCRTHSDHWHEIGMHFASAVADDPIVVEADRVKG